ncbi:MAG TPA: hypothetical protein VFE90_10450 [Myxococcales bacterium]|nr:hypothetical protein [Myxococcales bacterium]
MPLFGGCYSFGRFLPLAAVLLAAAARAEEPAAAIPGGHLYLGPSLQLIYAGGASPGGAAGLQMAYDFGDWIVGADASAGILRTPTYFLSSLETTSTTSSA